MLVVPCMGFRVNRARDRTVGSAAKFPEGEPMAQLITQFEKACSNVEPEDEDIENAVAAHEAVRDVLDGDPELTKLRIETVLIGSYKRHVSIRRVKDVDVFSRTADLDMTGAAALEMFERILSAHPDFENHVEVQARSIKVEFPDFDLHVDAVPARPAGDYMEIPDPEGGWVETNPEELTTLSSKMNDRYDDLYVPIVKLIRQTRRHNLGDHPGGLYFEVLTYHGFNAGLTGNNRGELYVAALRSVADQLADVVAGSEVEDPTMAGKFISVRATDDEHADAATTFADLATKAETALANTDKCAAALAFRELLGKTTDGEWVFPMPATCNADGTTKAFGGRTGNETAGDKEVPAGDRRFA